MSGFGIEIVSNESSKADDLVIPDGALAPDPESRDSGFASAIAPEMTTEKICASPDSALIYLAIP